MDAGEAKRAVRARLRRERSALPPEVRAHVDAAIARAVCAHPAFHAAQVVFAYAAMPEEVATLPIVATALRAGKAVCFPRCVRLPGSQRCLQWHRVEDPSELVAGAHGIMEPEPCARTLVPDDVLADTTALALVPGLAFDRAGYRLGYGGGYYDRFLTLFRGVSLGLVRDRFLVDDLGALQVIEPHDQPVDAVASEDGAWYVNGKSAKHSVYHHPVGPVPPDADFNMET